MSALSPSLSAILPTDTYDTIRDTLDSLRAQSVHDKLEIVIVATSVAGLGPEDGACEGFHSTTIVEVPQLEPMSWARAQGVRAASAPIVLFAESHSYPAPRACETLIEAHQGPWAAVGMAMGNANPATMRSWASLYLDYGPWVEASPRGVVDMLPGHNSSFKRSVLLEYEDELEKIMESGNHLTTDLRARGYELYLEPDAKTYHLNVTRPISWLMERIVAGRAYAGFRSRPWSLQRRFLYMAAWPLIPAVRLRRILGYMRSSARGKELLPRVLPALAVNLVISAFGEGIGYAIGAGGAMRHINEMELHRVQYVRRADRPASTRELSPS